MASAVESITDTFARRLKLHGETIALPVGTTRYFDDPRSVWFIVDGSVALFAIQRRGGRQTGPRQHLATLTPGALIWGIEQSPLEDGIHLLALSEADTRLVQLDVVDIEAMQRERSATLADAVDRWIAALSQGVSRYLSPHGPTLRAIGVGEEVSLADRERIGGHRGVVWVTLVEGECSYFDVARIGAVDGAPILALTPWSWLEANGTCVLQSFATDSLLAEGALVPQLDQLHRWLFYCLAYSFRAMTSMEDARLRARENRIAADTENTLSGLIALLNAESAIGLSAAHADALFRCCSMVGELLGTPMVLPAGWEKQRRAEERPLEIEDIAAASHLRVRTVVLRGRWWTEDNGPLVAFVEQDKRPVALLPRSGHRYLLYDPATGRRQKVSEKVALTLSPTAHVFYPSLPDRVVGGAGLLRFGLKRCWKDLLVIAGAGAAGGFLATSIPLATGYVFDAVIPDHGARQLLQVALALLVIAFSATVFHFVVDVAQLRAEGKISGSLQAAFMDRLLRLPNNFYARYSAGDLALRILVIEWIRREITGVVLSSIIAGVFSIFSLILLFYYSPLAAGVSLVLVLIMAGAVLLVGLSMSKSVAASERLSGKVGGLVLQIISGINKLRLTAAEERAFNLWGGLFGQMRRWNVAIRKTVNAYKVFWSGYEILCLAAIYAVIGGLSSNTISTGNFLGFVAAFTSFFAAMSALANSAIAIFAVVPRYRRALPIVQAEPESALGKADPGSLTGAFEINNVVFRYSPDTPPVLNGLSMQVASGEFIAVVGPSGSGKSTLMRLLLGFENPEAGGVFYDGHDLRGLDLRRVRSQIGVVLQNGRLMPGSIYENIRGATRATLEDCLEAAAQAGVAEDIRDMPMGMHTVLTEGTSSLSGGQVQRLLIARAIVGKPRLLLMDEATSALDNQTQAVVTESLDRLSVTRIVIAHRLSTVMKANRIYVVKQGRVVECGSYRELMAMNGVFAELAKRQQI